MQSATKSAAAKAETIGLSPPMASEAPVERTGTGAR